MKLNYHKLIGPTLLLCLVAATCALFIGGAQHNRKTNCTGIRVSVNKTALRGFIDKPELISIVKKQLGREILGTKIKDFNLKGIESTLESNMWISNAQLYFDNNNVLHIIASQRVPIARIITKNNQSFYIDSNFIKLPLSTTDRANVPVFTGILDSTSSSLPLALANNIIAMSKYIVSDSFWLAQAAQIDFDKGNFTLYPTVGFHTCNLGNGSNPKNKLERLKWFYTSTAKTLGFDAWTALSAEFDNQIVALRSSDSLQTTSGNENKAVQIFSQIVSNNKQQAAEVSRNETPTHEKALNPKKQKTITMPNDTSTLQENTEKTPTPKAVMPKNNNNSNK